MTADPPHALPRIADLQPAGDATDQISLIYDDRLVRRKRLRAESGAEFLADFAKATELPAGSVLVLDTGARVRVEAAPEPLFELHGDLPRMAWHIGNRHTPCQIGDGWLRIRQDAVLARMLRGLGADLVEIEAPFTPEGGAYGHGRTFGHDHAPAEHHQHGPSHGA